MADDKDAVSQAILAKLRTKAAVSDDELKVLQQRIDVLEQAAAGSHHHDHDSKLE